MATAALAYARIGWDIVPLYTIAPDGSCTCGRSGCSNQGKHPRTQHGFKDATRDPRQIESLFRRPSNVAIATGSGTGIWVLDVDGAEGEASLEGLTNTNGALPTTIELHHGRRRSPSLLRLSDGQERREQRQAHRAWS